MSKIKAEWASRRMEWVLAAAMAICGLAGGARADVEPDAAMLRNPAISDSRIAFVYANQLWTAPRTGGGASPVAAPNGRAGWPRFSPDGRTIAFVGNYDGNPDVYSLPLSGGVPTRVTHHPAGETLCGWTPDGRLLFNARSMMGDHWASRLYTVAPTGGLPEALPVPYGTFGAISRDGEWLAYTPWSRDTATWKRYRGGTAADIWLYNLKSGTAKKITDWEGSDLQPMWGYGRASKTVYYITDAGPEHRMNIWSYDTENGERTQVTKFADDDVKWPSVGPGAPEDKGRGEIVFQVGSRLMVLNLDTKEARAVKITIPGARPRLRAQVKDAAQHITNFGLSPSGKRALFTARGEIFSVPVKEGVARNLTNTSGANERGAAWSPDGRYIAYFSDASGEYELYLRSSDAKAAGEDKDEADKKDGDAKEKDADAHAEKPGDKAADKAADKAPEPRLKDAVKVTSIGAGFKFPPVWLQDSKHLVFSDNAGDLMLATIGGEPGAPKAEVKTIDTDPWQGQMPLSWTHDSAWIAYVRADEGTTNGAVWLYNVETGQKSRVTTPMFGVTDVAFDRKGDVLYFKQRCDISNPVYGDGDGAFAYAGTERLLMAPLRADAKVPLWPKSDEESIGADKKDDKKDDDKKDGKKEDKKDEAGDKKDAKPDADKKDDEKKDDAKKKADAKKPVKIDLDGFERRAVRLPVDAGSFQNLAVSDDGKLVYVRTPARGQDAKPSLKFFDAYADEKEEKEIVGDCSGYGLSADGKRIIAKLGDKYKVVEVSAGGGKAREVALGGMKASIDPREEWKEIFQDGWRAARDYFYVENMHGVDWNKAREHYGKMIEDCASREDVNFVIGEMISELNVGHAYLWAPGDVDQPPSVGVGLLGCDFELAGDGGQKAYRIKEVYGGAPWDSDARSPIESATPVKDRPKVGDYLLAVNGRAVDTKEDPWAPFVGLADKAISITVSTKPTMDDSAREVLVKTVAADGGLRYRHWIERKRAYVAEKSGGKAAYIYVPNTGVEGQNDLFRQFFGQIDRAGMIIDERWNGGGQIPWRFIELLNRPVTNYWAVRHGQDGRTPPESHQGPKCMLINEQAGSGGDMFPWLFRQNKLGKIIGMRTWGGLVGISGNPQFVDGGSITVPDFGFYKTDGTWGVEGHGVDPDIEVIDDPSKMASGGDPQLDAAIQHILEEVRTHPYKPGVRPPSPDRSGMGIPEKDR